MPYPSVDLTRVKTYPLEKRENRVALEDLIFPHTPYRLLENSELGEVSGRIAEARRNGKPFIFMFGAHVIKRGLAPLVIDLLKRGVITHLASNGAATIHDFEIAFQGHTSEDVVKSLEDGSFGMAEETGLLMNMAIQGGVSQGLGIGEALGRLIAEDERFVYREHSVLYNAYKIGVPFTVHVAIGTDIIHQHPRADFAAIGWASGQDFKIFSQAVCGLQGGVFGNFGSSVIGPEVFLKALSIARNLGHVVKVFTTANFDLVQLGDYRKPIGDEDPDYYYRPRKNIVNRPVASGGRGYHITGDHRDTLPNLYHQIVAQLEPIQPVSQNISAPAPYPPEFQGLAGPATLSTISGFVGAEQRQNNPEKKPSLPLGGTGAGVSWDLSSSELLDSGRENRPISRLRLEQILGTLKNLTLGVVGDFTLDGYWYADMEQSQLSRETATFPRPIVRETYSLGGAANAAWNLSELGVGAVYGFSIVGDDWRGKILRERLAKAHIHTDGILNQAGRQTPFYGKIILTAAGRTSQEDARLDFINNLPLSAEIEDALLDGLAAALAELDGLIVADYQPMGVISPRVTHGLIKIAGENPQKPFVVDSRQRAGEFRQLILKPNDAEAARLFFPDRRISEVELAELIQAAVQHNQQTGQPIIITRGEHGCLVAAGGKCVSLAGVPVRPPLDPVGAGDAFLAAFTAATAGGANALEAACLANLAAAVTVTKIGVTGTASPAEILAMYDLW
jgi:rfaE bifunctional protein kinase chain/domain